MNSSEPLHQRVERFEHASLPQRLNEGLASQLAGDPWRDLHRVMSGEVTLIPLTRPEGGWAGFPSHLATVAYLEGHSATASFLIERDGLQSLTTAVKDRLFISYDEFQQRWADHLSEKIRAGQS